MNSIRLGSLLATWLLFVAVWPAAARQCGDDVAGRRVPCSCGDVVVSDVRVLAGDPVATEVCPGDGLIVRPPAASRGLTVDLGGLTLAGSGHGAGIRVLGAARVVIEGGSVSAPGRITGFATGVRAAGTRAVAEVRNLVIEDNLGTGLFVRSHGARIAGVVARNNGREGVRATGRALLLEGVRGADNGRAAVVSKDSRTEVGR